MPAGAKYKGEGIHEDLPRSMRGCRTDPDAAILLWQRPVRPALPR